MSFRVRLSREAAAYLRSLPSNQRQRIERRLDALSANPRDTQHSKPLTGGQGEWSSRVGGWRIIYIADLDTGIVDVLRIAPRGQVYRGL